MVSSILAAFLMDHRLVVCSDSSLGAHELADPKRGSMRLSGWQRELSALARARFSPSLCCDTKRAFKKPNDPVHTSGLPQRPPDILVVPEAAQQGNQGVEPPMEGQIASRLRFPSQQGSG
jgi:hypothetical protein